MSSLEDLGYGPYFSAQLELLERPELAAARVIADGRGVFPLAGCQAAHGEPTGKLKSAIEAGQAPRPAVGDWVAVTHHGDQALIHHVLDRRSALRRRAAGSDSQGQVIAANVDLYFVVTAVGRDFNLRRLERYLTAIWDSGATPLVVLNKVDLAKDVADLLQQIQGVALGVDVVGVSALEGSGLPALTTHLGPGVSAAFVGSSGVGKSSLVNRILGANPAAPPQTQPTSALGAVGKGRHTTTRRELFALPGGGVLIDTAGLRELGMLDHGSGLDAAFADIAALAEDCRFTDCEHSGEPGCAVAAAADGGGLSPARLASYRALKRETAAAEIRRDPVQGANAKKRWKTIHKNMRARGKVDGKRGGG